MYHITMKDSEITKNLIVFFLLIAGLTFILGLLGYFIQESDFRQEIEEESRASYLESN
jgi:sensor domain CHASE-containing protein